MPGGINIKAARRWELFFRPRKRQVNEFRGARMHHLILVLSGKRQDPRKPAQVTAPIGQAREIGASEANNYVSGDTRTDTTEGHEFEARVFIVVCQNLAPVVQFFPSSFRYR